jgi:CBS domain-containing protein
MVIDRGKVIGILTDRDIVLRGVAAERNLSEIPVRKIMTVNPTTINVNYDVVDAVWLMRTRGVRRLPIVDQHRRVFGIITLDDILAKYGTDAGDLAGTVEKELGLETADRTVKH